MFSSNFEKHAIVEFIDFVKKNALFEFEKRVIDDVKKRIVVDTTKDDEC